MGVLNQSGTGLLDECVPIRYMRNMEPIRDLKTFRKTHKPPLSQKQLAAMIGCSRVAVTRWESGVRKPDEEFIPIISAVTGIPGHVLRPDLADLLEMTKASRGPPRRRRAA
jgi:transcriptional regulator with XRE-family HTH domain